MARASVRQSNFASGELDVRLASRPELDRYKNGCRQMVNWWPLLQGGATRVPGTVFLALLWGPARIEAFEFSVDEWFLFVFQASKLLIYKNDALHQTLDTPWAEADLWELDYTQTLDAAIVVHEDHPPHRVQRGVGDVFTLTDLSAGTLTNLPQEDGSDAWSDVRGWPRTVTFCENRLAFGGSRSYPATRWFSKSGDYYNFAAGTGLADESITDIRLSNQYEAIQWVAYLRRFVSGTVSQEWAAPQDSPITPDSIDIRPQTSIGSERVSPVSIDGTLLHVARGGKQVHELTWTDVEQAYTTRPTAALSPRATTGVIQLAALRSQGPTEPHRVFAVNADGTVGVFSALRDQDFQAWSRRTFEGSCESIASVGGQVYAVVSYRWGPGTFSDDVYEEGVYEESGGSSSRFLVKLDATVYTDFSKTVTSGVETTSWAGFDHLAGREVQVRLDGGTHPPVTVGADGTITTAIPGLVCVAGAALPVPTLEPVSPVVDTTTGTVAFEKRRIGRATLQLYETASLYIRGSGITLRQAADSGGAPTPFTGTVTRTLLGYSREPTVLITAPDPQPATVLALTQEVVF